MPPGVSLKTLGKCKKGYYKWELEGVWIETKTAPNDDRWSQLFIMRLPMKEEGLVLKGKTDLCHEDSRNYKKWFKKFPHKVIKKTADYQLWQMCFKHLLPLNICCDFLS